MALELEFLVKDGATVKIQQLKKELGLLDPKIKKVDNSMGVMNNSLAKLAVGYISLQGAMNLTKSFIAQADSMTLINSKLKLVTKSTEELADVQSEIVKISQETRTALDGNVTLYQRMSMSTKELNLSQTELLDLTRTISKSMIVSGTDVAGVNALVTQLGQAFSSNFQAVAQEIGTLRDQSPRLYQAILKGTETTGAEFKKMAENGELTNKIIIDAIKKGTKEIAEDYSKMGQTIGQSMQNISTSTLLMVGNMDKVLGVSDGVVGALNDVNSAIFDLKKEDIENYADLAKNIGLVGGSLLGAKIALAGYSKISASVIASNGLMSVSYTALTTSLGRAMVATKALSLAMKTIPFVAIASGIYLIVDAWIDAKDAAEEYKKISEEKSKGYSGKGVMADLQYETAVKNLTTAFDKMEFAEKAHLATRGTQNEAWYKGLFETAKKEYEAIEKETVAISNRTFATIKKSKEESGSNGSSGSKGLSDKELKAIQKQLELNERLNDTYIAITGSEYDAWANETSNKMIEMAESTSITNEELEKYHQKLLEIRETGLLEQRAEIQWDDSEESDAIDNSILEERNQLEKEWASLQQENHMSMLDSQIALAESTNDWADGLTGVAGEVSAVGKAYSKLQVDQLKATKAQAKLDAKFNKDYNKYWEDEEKAKQLKQDYIKNTAKIEATSKRQEIAGYANLAGAMSQSFKEGSDGAKAFQKVQQGLALYNAVTAMTGAWASAPFPFNIPAVVATGVGVAGLLSQIGVSFGGGGNSANPTQVFDTASQIEANNGTGSLLGSDEASMSLINSMEELSDYAKPEYFLLAEMNSSLKSIDASIGGVSSLLLRSGGYALGEDFSATSTQSFSKLGGIANDIEDTAGVVAVGLLTGVVGLAIDHLLLGGAITKVLGSTVGKLFGGGTSSQQYLHDYGLLFNQQLVEEAINQIDGSAYQTIKTHTVRSRSWGRSDVHTDYYDTRYQELDNEIERQFQLIIGSMYDSVVMSGDALDTARAGIIDDLDDFVIKIGKLSFKGKTGDEMQENISNVFSKIADDMVLDAFPALQEFQQVGEGLFETLSRVSIGMEVAEGFMSKLGNSFEDIAYTDLLNKQGDVGLEALRQSILAFETTTYSATTGVYDMVQVLGESADELFDFYSTFEDMRFQLEAIGKSTQYLSASMITGAGDVDTLASGMEDFIDNFLTEQEQLAYQTDIMTSEFEKLNLSLPASKDSFRSLVESIDVTTNSGQEFYGRVISLSDGFNDLIEDSENLTDSLASVSSSMVDIIDKAIIAIKGNEFTADELTEDEIRRLNLTQRSFASSIASDDAESAQELLTEITNLSKSISGSAFGDTSLLDQNLISNLEATKALISFEDEVINVNIVSSELTTPVSTDTYAPSVTVSNPTNDSERLDNLEAIMTQVLITNRNVYDLLQRIENDGLKAL